MSTLNFLKLKGQTLESLASQIQQFLDDMKYLYVSDGELNSWNTLEEIPSGYRLISEYIEDGRYIYILGNVKTHQDIFVFSKIVMERLTKID
jgi:hypothetical protein